MLAFPAVLASVKLADPTLAMVALPALALNQKLTVLLLPMVAPPAALVSKKCGGHGIGDGSCRRSCRAVEVRVAAVRDAGDAAGVGVDDVECAGGTHGYRVRDLARAAAVTELELAVGDGGPAGIGIARQCQGCRFRS